MDTPALILAGGLGTRLRSVIGENQKVLAPVRGRPFLELILEQVAKAGIRHAVLAVGYRSQMVEETFGQNFAGINLVYAREESPLGTGGAIRAAAALLSTKDVLVMNGDSYCEVDLAAFLQAHRDTGAHATLVATQVPDAAQFGSLTFDKELRLVAFREKTGLAAPGWINAGIYALRRELIESIPLGMACSLERDILPGWLSFGVRVYCASGTFYDIGTPDSYRAAQASAGIPKV